MPRIDPITLCQIEIHVADLKRSLDFYTHVFGWTEAPADIHGTIIFEVPTGSPFGIRLIESTCNSSPSHRSMGVVPYFRTESFTDLAQRVKDYGGHCDGDIQKIQGYGSVIIIEDLDGNKIGLFMPEQREP